MSPVRLQTRRRLALASTDPVRRVLRFSLLAVCLTTCLGRAAITTGDPPALVTYVANEGFLIEAGGAKVLVDGLFGDERIDWCDSPDANLQERLAQARAPFDKIDLILITHWHVDHCVPSLVLRHLAADERPHVVAPAQVIARLREAKGWSEQLAERIHEIKLELFESATVELPKIVLEALRVRHCRYMIEDEDTGARRDKHAGVENLAFAISLGPTTYLHIGDAILDQNREVFEVEPFTSRRFSVVFLFGPTPGSLEILRHFQARDVVIMHLPPAGTPAFQPAARRMRTMLPGAVVFEKPLEARNLPRPLAASK